MSSCAETSRCGSSASRSPVSACHVGQASIARSVRRPWALSLALLVGCQLGGHDDLEPHADIELSDPDPLDDPVAFHYRAASLWLAHVDDAGSSNATRLDSARKALRHADA